MSVSSSRVLRFASGGAKVFGKYTILAKLGQGGMADVYLAVVRGPAGFSKLVVIKRLKVDVGEDPEFRQMFLDEGKLAARLNHVNIVQSNEVGEIDGHHYLAMEFLDGQPLNRIIQRLKKRNESPVSEYLRVLSETLAGLHYAHDLTDFDGTPLGVVHRDVSPHNIFVTYDGQVKLVDFGIAKAATRSQNTATGVVKGKISYMAPEQALCAPVDRRADVFSVGVMLWELWCGRRFWGDLSEVQILKKMAFGDVEKLSETTQDVPPELDRICNKALSMVPADRYDTALDFKKDLDAFIASVDRKVDGTEVGKLVSELFEDRRQEVKSLIQDRLASLKVGADDGAEGRETLPELNADGTVPPDEGTRPPVVSSPSIDSAPASTSGVIATGMPATEVTQTRPPMKSLARPLGLAAGGVVVIAALVVGLKVGSSESTPETSASAPADEAGLIVVRIETEPQDATIFVDDTPAGKNPFSAKFPSDGTAHRIRVEAEGHETHEEMVAFDANVERKVVLKKKDEDAPAAASATASAAASASASAAPDAGPAVRPPWTGAPVPPKPPTATKTGSDIDRNPWD